MVVSTITLFMLMPYNKRFCKLGLWELEDRDDGSDTWEWVTALKPMDVNFVCGSTDKEVTTVTSKKRGRGKERNIVGGRRRRRE